MQFIYKTRAVIIQIVFQFSIFLNKFYHKSFMAVIANYQINRINNINTNNNTISVCFALFYWFKSNKFIATIRFHMIGH